jgi:HEAT repeat protein
MSTQASDAAGRSDEDVPRLTTRLEDVDIRRRDQDERVTELILALGDPTHPLHAQAVSELVAIGSPALGALTAALHPDRAWLTSYRAAEALAQIGDGRASGALISALRHPNSNVRWSVVRALAEVGDTRTLWALRRVANEDRGKTSWGESVADTAQLSLDRLQSRSAILRFTEPIKTAIVFVAMFAALLFAVDRAQAVRDELRTVVAPPPPIPVVATAGPEEEEEVDEAVADVEVTPEPEVTPAPEETPAPAVITGTVRAGSGNVRSVPELGNNVVGLVNEGDELIFLGENSRGDWYLVRLGEQVSDRSFIRPGEGWVSGVVVNEPTEPLPTVTIDTAPTPTPTTAP